MAPDLVIRNGTLVSSSGRRRADVAIADGQISEIAATIDAAGVGDVIDATDQFVLPGLIDGHVHFREPGLEHEETWLTGSRAAVMGGITTVLDMPNTVPPTDTADRARAKLALAARSAYCDFGIFGLVGESLDPLPELANSGLVVGLKVFMGPTTGGLRAPDDDGLRSALAIARQAALRVAFHAEEREMIEGFETALRESGRTDPLAHLEAREASEATAIAHIGGLLVQTRAAGHILHLSTQAGMEFVDQLRTALDLTSEVTPHHLLLERDVYATAGGVARVNPPIRGGEDAAALRAALADGHIDMVATDHAPHLADEKRRASIWDVPSGFAGVETMLSLLLTRGVHEGWMSLERLVAVTSEAPARIWGLSQKGRVEPGADADLTIIDLDKPGTISAATLHGLNNLSPFEGWSTRGAAVTTIVRGRPVVRDGALVGEPGWGANVIR